MSSKIVHDQTVPPFVWRTLAPKTGDVTNSDNERAEAEFQWQTKELEASIAQREAAAAERGRQQGIIEGEKRGRAAIEPLMARMARTIEDFALTRRTLHREAEKDVIKLAIAIAKRILCREVSLDPEVLIGIARAALDRIEARELLTVRVHPDDVGSLTREKDALHIPRAVEISGDPGLERGSLVFETRQGVLDASLTSQLAEIDRGLADMWARRGA